MIFLFYVYKNFFLETERHLCDTDLPIDFCLVFFKSLGVVLVIAQTHSQKNFVPDLSLSRSGIPPLNMPREFLIAVSESPKHREDSTSLIFGNTREKNHTYL